MAANPRPASRSSHTPLFDRLQDDIDLNAGTILDNTESVQQTGLRLFELLIAVASGQPTHSERHGMGDEEFAPWQLGPTF
jgi:altronate hydrolase